MRIAGELSFDQELIGHVRKLRGVRVLCAGDVMLDHFVYGEVDRISPEGPIPVLRIEREDWMLGGAGNVARNLDNLGAEVRFLAVCGEDWAAERIRELCKALRGCKAEIAVEPGRKTAVKTRYVAQSQQLLRADAESNHDIASATLERLLTAFRDALPDSDIVILSDYAKGVLNGRHASAFLKLAAEAGKPVLVDPKGRNFERYRGAALVKPNLKELSEATGMNVRNDAEIEAAAKGLLQSSGLAALLVTRGSAGMTLVQEDSVRHFPSFAREVYDVSGAGDTVAAVLGGAMGAGLPLEEAVTLANVSAGLVVAKVGTAVVTPEEIIQEIRYHSRPSADRKLLSVAEAADEASKWRRLGLRIGFTSGCFDLLHPGHIALLKQARESCDRLIVGLNSNRSAAAIKGPNRPVQDEVARATVLASLAFVDAVVIFDDLTPENLIRALRPDVLVRGADYRPDDGAAADLVRAWGGEVVLADFVPGHSTTRTIHRFVSGSEQ